MPAACGTGPTQRSAAILRARTRRTSRTSDVTDRHVPHLEAKVTIATPSPRAWAGDPDGPAPAERSARSGNVAIESRSFGVDEGRRVRRGVAVIRVFLLDDHELVRHGLRDLLESEDDITVVGEASTVAEARTRIPLTAPDVANLDVQLPDGDGIEVCRDARAERPDLVCLMLTSFADDEALLAAVVAGASGYVLKQIRESDLVSTVRRVARGDSLLDPRQVERVRARLGRVDEDERLARLSPQERKILDLISQGKTNREVAAELYLAEKTVKNYVSNLLVKLGMRRRTEAAVFAVEARHHDRPTFAAPRPPGSERPGRR